MVFLFMLYIPCSAIDLWGMENWWIGTLMGLTLFGCWALNQLVGIVLGIVGLLVFAMAISGDANYLLLSKRALFNGVSVGMIVGIFLWAVFHRNLVRARLLRMARNEKKDWLVRLLGEKL